jgi:hypothetical protein
MREEEEVVRKIGKMPILDYALEDGLVAFRYGEGASSGDHFVRLEVDALLASSRLADLFRGYLSLWSANL